MKYTTIIDPHRDQEVIIYAHRRAPEVEALEDYIRRMDTELLGYGKDGQIIPLRPDDITCFIAEEGRVYALTDEERLSVRLPLYALEETLGDGFIRINQSCLGNIRKIHHFDASIGGSLMVTFTNGHRDFVSRRQLKTVKERMGMKK